MQHDFEHFLDRVIRKGDVFSLRKILLEAQENGIDVNGQGRRGQTLLHRSSSNADMVRELLTGAGKEVGFHAANQGDEYGETVLHRAAFFNNVSVVRTLIQSEGAFSAFLAKTLDTGRNALHFAAGTYCGDGTELCRLLLTSPETESIRKFMLLDVDKLGNTSLHLAATGVQNKAELIRGLFEFGCHDDQERRQLFNAISPRKESNNRSEVEDGADENKKNKDEVPTRRRRNKNSKLIIDAPALQDQINHAELLDFRVGETALHIAARTCCAENVLVLVDLGERLGIPGWFDVPNQDGMSALQLAITADFDRGDDRRLATVEALLLSRSTPPLLDNNTKKVGEEEEEMTSFTLEILDSPSGPRQLRDMNINWPIPNRVSTNCLNADSQSPEEEYLAIL